MEFTSLSSIKLIYNITRGGVILGHNNTLKVGDIVPLHIKYENIDIETKVKVVQADSTEAAAVFLDLEGAVSNKILYLSMIAKDKIAYNKDFEEDE